VKSGTFLDKDTQYKMPRYRSIPLGILYRANDIEIKKNEIPDYEVSQERYDGFGVRGVKRPIVLVTDKKDHDSDQWQRISLQNIPDDISQLVLDYLKDQHEKEMLMLKNDKVNPKDVDITPIDKYTKNELRMTEAWKSKTGSILYGIGYSRETVILTVNNDDPIIHKIFILAEHDKTPVFIHDQLELVDIGDYDGNGDSEFIFWTTKENRDGYILCWGCPLKKTSGRWSYH
jgi:hypothetical protein